MQSRMNYKNVFMEHSNSYIGNLEPKDNGLGHMDSKHITRRTIRCLSYNTNVVRSGEHDWYRRQVPASGRNRLEMNEWCHFQGLVE